MTDICDRAAVEEERERTEALRRQAARAAQSRILPVGVCHNCDEPVLAGRLFCDCYCREDYEQRVKQKGLK